MTNHFGLCVPRYYVQPSVITKIIDTIHTVGIISFSMYEHFTRPSDGFPKQTQRQDFKAFRFTFDKSSSGHQDLNVEMSGKPNLLPSPRLPLKNLPKIETNCQESYQNKTILFLQSCVETLLHNIYHLIAAEHTIA